MADYLGFVSDLKFYMECDLVENTAESKQYNYPVGTLVSVDDTHRDVNIYFTHYQTFDNAKQKWQDRQKRIIWLLIR